VNPKRPTFGNECSRSRCSGLDVNESGQSNSVIRTDMGHYFKKKSIDSFILRHQTESIEKKRKLKDQLRLSVPRRFREKPIRAVQQFVYDRHPDLVCNLDQIGYQNRRIEKSRTLSFRHPLEPKPFIIAYLKILNTYQSLCVYRQLKRV
jgi:hypothetical protein